ncbi:MAG TPA: hypothetical protein VEB59_13985 [Gemmatimonadales bacterium]|nr:hypothetical protein [Gemmatimonadales bacterium]
MPELRDVLVRTVRQWKAGADRGDVNALIRRLDDTLSPLVGPQAPKLPRKR